MTQLFDRSVERPKANSLEAVKLGQSEAIIAEADFFRNFVRIGHGDGRPTKAVLLCAEAKIEARP